MIEFDKFTLKNGLRVIVHRDETTPMAGVNIWYNIGSIDEKPENFKRIVAFGIGWKDKNDLSNLLIESWRIWWAGRSSKSYLLQL